MDLFPPDELFTAAEAAAELEKSPKQVRRYMESGRLRASRASGRWQTTALDLWRFKGVETEMTKLWLDYCLACRHAEREAGADADEALDFTMNEPDGPAETPPEAGGKCLSDAPEDRA
ncbi:MAG: hypothetical protein ACNS61_05900 [Candidatus Wenzhouxiangella sp. M2_3B_020]